VNDDELLDQVRALPKVREVRAFSRPYRLVSREFRGTDSVVSVGQVRVGAEEITLMAGPCAVESREQLFEAARGVKEAGATVLRGGAFKPRTSPYGFQGLKETGLKLLAEARREFGLKIVTEVLSPQDVELVAAYADILQVGARNMQNFSLLERLGRTEKPVLLKRGMMATLEELLMSAEYIVSGGNPNVILCERGIRTFERATRYTLDVSAVPALKEATHLPVVVDPSHAAGNSRYVESLALASVAAGADGLLIEVHPSPDEALCDGKQSLTPAAFAGLVSRLRRVAGALERSVPSVKTASV
ncbi:MAG: 3-deoxy-7-phosphoheptulonate synthase, partial [Planctomycetota bacterium]|nr:3-deoxy-7-phosphoheptulonate synthase [Planctomycetota bacterium]